MSPGHSKYICTILRRLISVCKPRTPFSRGHNALLAKRGVVNLIASPGMYFPRELASQFQCHMTGLGPYPNITLA